MEQRN